MNLESRSGNYTVTERVPAACRLNVEKARKAVLERRFCATRGTDAEHDVAHANLEPPSA
jgi:hypothetical protein